MKTTQTGIFLKKYALAETIIQ